MKQRYNLADHDGQSGDIDILVWARTDIGSLYLSV